MSKAALDHEKRVMLEEIARQPQFVAETVDPLMAQLRGLLAPKARSVGEAVLIGCGDSLAVALATRRYFARAAGIPAQAVQSFEFAHYTVGTMGRDAAVIAISNSGSVALTVEGARRAKDAGAWTIAVTANEESPLARICDTLAHVEAPQNFKTAPDGRTLVTPGTVTYTASVLGVLVCALAFKAARGGSDADIDGALADLRRLPNWMREADERTRETAKALAPSFTEGRKLVFAGGGPSLGTAYFAAAKWYEGLGEPAHAAQMEEWAHQQYFFTGPDTDTVFILPEGPSRTRGLAQVSAARRMGSRVIAVAAADDDEAADAADLVFAMPSGVPEDLATLVYKAPLELLACYASEARGRAFLGYDDARREETNRQQIF